MSVIRVKKRENPFAQIDKSLLNNPSLRWQEKGLLAYLLSLPDDWSIYINELTKHSENARDSTARIINNLIKKGYIIRERKREKGTFRGYNYYVFESPQLAESWFSVNGDPVNGKSVNGKADTTNNNLTNNNLTNNINKECVNTQKTPPIEKEKEIDKPTQEDPVITITDQKEKRKKVAGKKEKFIPPKAEEVYEVMVEYEPKKIKNIHLYPDFKEVFDFGMLANKFHNHYTANEWKVGRNKMKDYTATARNWVLSEFGKWINERKPNASYDNANNNEARYGAAKVSDIKQALFELDQEKREGVFF